MGDVILASVFLLVGIVAGMFVQAIRCEKHNVERGPGYQGDARRRGRAGDPPR